MRWVSLWLLLAALAWSLTAQTDPAIVAFDYDLALNDALADADLPPVTINTVENADLTITLRWAVINAADDQQVLLETYRVAAWVPVPKDDDNPEAPYGFSDERTLDLQHPLNFGPPTYRLSVVNADGDRLHERVITVPYAIPAEADPPNISQFSLPLTVDAAQLHAVPVTWIVENRPPGSNLVFEQVLADGETLNAENERTISWVPSTGEGTIRLRPPQAGNAVITRLSVVDVVSGEVLEQRGAVVAVTGEVPIRTPRPAGPLTGDPLDPQSDPGVINLGAPPQITPPATDNGQLIYQPFEDGFMLRNVVAREIWALADNGQVFFYPEINYAPLPTNPITDTPPIDRLMPEGDFGRVWGNYVNVRAVLGWATGTQQSYNTPVNSVTIGTVIEYALDLPNGDTINARSDGTWAVHDPSLATTPLPLQGPQVINLGATDTSFAPGQTITLTWEVENATTVTLEVYDRGDVASLQAENPAQTLVNLPPVGTETVTIPATFTDGARVLLLAYDDVQATNRFTATRATLDLVRAVGTPSSPTATPTQTITIDGVYQPFEGGFMLWRSDTGTIYVIIYEGGLTIAPLSSYSGFPDNPVTEDPPPGRVMPVRGFGLVWGNITGVREAVGWALQDEIGYAMTVRPAVTGSNPGDLAVLLPSGTFVVIRTDGTWSYE